MDKKNTLIGVLFIAAAIFVMVQQTRDAARQAEAEQAARQVAEQQEKSVAAQAADDLAEAHPDAAPTGRPASRASDGGPSVFAPSDASATGPVEAVESEVPEKTWTLANEHIRVTFTSKGGAIKEVAFITKDHDGGLKYPAVLGSEEPYVFNAGSDIAALAISLDTNGDGKPEAYAPDYKLDEIDETGLRVQFSFKDPNGGAIIRAYVLAPEGGELDPYVVQHETYFVNQSKQPLDLQAVYLNVGTAPPTKGDVTKDFLNFGYYVGDDATFLKMRKFDGSKGIMGMGAHPSRDYIAEGLVSPDNGQGEVVWASIKNQFFASVLTPEGVLGTGIFAEPVDMSASVEDPDLQRGMTGALEFNLGTVNAGERKAVQATYYVGPKEYFRLSTLGQNQDEIMQFGFFGGISKILLWALVSIHGVIAHIAPTWGWGFSIILLTVIIKGLLWPLTQVQVRSAKHMAKIQGPMKELQEKYKDNPQKLQQETMKLFKEHKVNPAAGCLPIFIQMPIFFALYYMLRTSSDLRFSPFLWIKDLALPDTLPFLPAWFHLLPLLMGAAMVVQMRMTPTPTTDNFQRKLFQFMPLIFLVFCYRFPSGLVLYWTVQNCISIFQQWLTNRSREEGETEGGVTNAPAPAKKAAKTAPAKTVKKRK